MKIGLVLSSTPGYSETFFTSKIKGLQEHGFEVILFTQAIKQDFELCQVIKATKVYKNPVFQVLSMVFVFAKLLANASTVIKFIRFERQENTSVLNLLKKIYLNSHMLSQKVDWLHFGFATQALGSELVAKAIGAKMAVSFRGFDISIYPLKYQNCYNLVWKHVDKVHTISNDLLNLAFNLGLSKNTNIQKITPAIDIGKFQKDIELASKQESIKILTVARLTWKKGIIDTLHALKIVKSKGYKFNYTIVGIGNEYERIAYAIDQFNLVDNVNLVGKKDVSEVIEIYANSNIYLQGSISEGFCNAVLEAQAMGLLCIVSDAEGLSENIIDAKTGWLVPKCNPEALAKKIIEVINLPEEKKTIITNSAIERVKLDFTIAQQTKKFIEFYSLNS